MEDIDRDRFMTPAEAIEYGLIDAVLAPGEPEGSHVDAAERSEVEIGFEGGGVVRCNVSHADAEELERDYRRGRAEPVELDGESGPIVVDLRRVVYVRSLLHRRPIGFGGP